MSIFFISDVHLDEERPEIAEKFLHFLLSQAIKADMLYILGDLFELWIGDDDQSPFNLSIIQGLKNLTNHAIPVCFMPGNRDFLIGKRFLKETGCDLIKDPYVATLYGQSVLLMHGDTLNSSDKKYQRMRRYFRNKLNQWLFLLKSIKKRRGLAKKYRLISKTQTQQKHQSLLDVLQKDVERVMLKHKVNYLIHGHTHQPGIHQFESNGKTVTRIVLGSWETKENVLICSPGENDLQFEWMKF